MASLSSLRTFNVFAQFHLIHECTTTAECSAVFDQKQHDHPPASPYLFTRTFFFVFWMKKVLKGKCFANVEELKQKTAEALKGVKIDEFKNCFVQWTEVLIGVLHQMETTLKVIEI